LHAAARPDRAHIVGEHRPVAQDRPRAVRLVGRKSQNIHEICEGREREPIREQEGDAQAFPGRGHDAIIQYICRRPPVLCPRPAPRLSDTRVFGGQARMTRFSAMSLLKNALTGHKGWTAQWPESAPKPEY